MKWKSDSIEQFVQYKILHPEQSFRSLKSYHTEKKHNQHLDQLKKELSKQRSQLNYFKSQLHKLNQIVLREVVSNSKGSQSIDKKSQQYKQKSKDLKQAKLDQNTVKKEDIQKEYDQRLYELDLRIKNQQNQWQQEISTLQQRLMQFRNSHNFQLITQKIHSTKEQIQTHRQRLQEVREKSIQVKSLNQKRQILHQQVTQDSQNIEQLKSQQELTQRTRQQQTAKSLKQMKVRMVNFKEQVRGILQRDNVFVSQQGVEQYVGKVFQQTGKQKAMFHPHIDMNFSKKKSVEVFVQNASISKPEQVQENIALVRRFLSQHRHQVNPTEDFSGRQNQCKHYVYNLLEQTQKNQFEDIMDSTEHYKKLMNKQTEIIQFIRQKSQSLYKQQARKLTQTQFSLQKQQNEIDKDIQDLQKKLKKTEQEILKKSR